MKILLWIVVVLVLIAGGAFFYASSLPEHTTHTRRITLKQSPDAIFALLTDMENMPKWNRNMKKIEMLPPIDGKEATRQTFEGNMQMVIITSERTSPSHLVRTMGDNNGPFAGSWTYEIKPVDGGSEVTLTEDSHMKNPFFRLMTKIFGETKYLDQHLQDMALHFGETATIR
ncbi:MAG: SRPBCC family protein [Verrucomicrobiota bacterium]|nr:SRPBCC family protein [Verrucomicrobiota bacterium]